MVENVINNHLNVKMNITLDICTTLDLDNLQDRLIDMLINDNKFNDTRIDILKQDIKNVKLCGSDCLEE